MRLLVCGSRDWTNYDIMEAVLDDAYHSAETSADMPLTIIHGAASGADSMAEEWGRKTFGNGYPVAVHRYPADWGRWGLHAGPIRNQEMLNEGVPDLVYAFSWWPITKGTTDMINRATAADVPVQIWTMKRPVPEQIELLDRFMK